MGNKQRATLTYGYCLYVNNKLQMITTEYSIAGLAYLDKRKWHGSKAVMLTYRNKEGVERIAYNDRA